MFKFYLLIPGIFSLKHLFSVVQFLDLFNKN